MRPWRIRASGDGPQESNDQREVPVYYQVVNLKTGLLAGFEALLHCRQKRRNRREWIDKKKDGAEREQRKAHNRRLTQVIDCRRGWIGEYHV